MIRKIESIGTPSITYPLIRRWKLKEGDKNELVVMFTGPESGVYLVNDDEPSLCGTAGLSFLSHEAPQWERCRLTLE